MLKPAILYKDELLKKFSEVVYDDNYFLYMGYAHGHALPQIEDTDFNYQWAIVDNNKVIGYFAYRIDPSCSVVHNFGLYSFDPGNIIVGKDVFTKMKELIEKYHRVEWRMIGGNPIQRQYDRFCKKYNGQRVILHDCTKDNYGNYRDDYIYEIINN